MKKISTLFKKDPTDLGRVIDEISPENSWVRDSYEWGATRKFDGTATAVIEGELYKRYDVKKGRSVPEGAIPCQDPDPVSGHHPHWVKCDPAKPEDKYFFEAIANRGGEMPPDGTYELCGPKINGNPEKLREHVLIGHGFLTIPCMNTSFESIKRLLSDPELDIEGIVFHHNDGRMCKIRKSDFGVKR